jgi:hypothetical protein
VITFCLDAKQRDKSIRLVYCQYLSRQNINDIAFVIRLLLTDEDGITRDEIFNYHNSHLFAENNPHACQVAHKNAICS